jgi:DNA-binding response OmpR family regulator
MSARVLLVDDDPVILRLLEVNFRLGGFAVETASRGEDALTAAAASDPEAVVLDVMMPGLDGFEVCRRLRELPGQEQTPVVFLTAAAQERGVPDEPLGPVDVVAKPFDPAQIVELVRNRITGASA